MLRSLKMLAAGTLALTALSCSPASGPAPKGAIRIQPSNTNCGIGPYVIPQGGTVTTEREIGARVEDGHGADVKCTVRPSGDGYYIEAQITQRPTSASLTGNIAPREEPASGNDANLSFNNPESLEVQGSGCSIAVAANQHVQPGAIWGSVTCALATKPATGQTCGVLMDFVFENCSD